MAEKIDELEVLITANTAQLKAGLKDVESKLSGISKSTGSFGTALSAKAVAIGGIISNVFSKVFNEIAQNLDAGIQRLDTLNNFTKVMGNLGIESGIAQQAINKLSDELQGLPTSLSDAVSSVQRFTAVNNSLAYSTDAYLALNNAILASGASTQMQASALEQITQAYSKGKPEMQDWKTMIQTMPAQLKQVGLAMGYASTTELYDALQAGEITMQDFMDTVMKLNTEGVAGFASFAEQARGATGGVQTSITNLKIAIQRGIANIINVLGQSNIAGFFNKIASAIGTASNYIAAFIKLIKQAVAWIGALFGKGGSTTETVKETGSAMGGVASGAGEVGDNLEKANGSAKKLKRTLAGFDEMNVLTESESGGSGSGVSAGGAGGIDISDYTWGDSGFAEATDKIEEALQKIKKITDKIFGKIDLDKIGKSIKQLIGDIKSALNPITKILGDIWNDYLQPFITWAGNELLPAFFNALGGAINFLGTIIGAVWDNALKPLIDDFLMPIAQWTGGVIVDILNGIGNALRAIAGNQTAIEAISRSLGLLFDSLLAYGIVTAATMAFNGLSAAFVLLTGQAPVLQASMVSTMATIAASTGNVGMLSAAANLSSASFSSFGGTITAFVAKLGPMIIAIEAVIAVIEAVKVVQEYNNLKTMEAEAATAEYNAKIFDETEAHQFCNDAIQAQIDLKNQLLGIQKTLADATLSLMSAQDEEAAARINATNVATQFGMTLEEAQNYVENLDIASGNLSEQDKKLAEAVYELDSKEGRLREAQEKVTEAKNKQTEASEQLYNQALKEYGMAQLQELQSKINEGRYDEVADALINMANATVEYTDENGRQCKIAGDDVKNYTDYVGDLLGKMDTDQSRAWGDIWSSASQTTDNIKGALNGLESNAYNNGAAVSNGIKNGIQNNQSGIFGVIGGLASGISNTFKSMLGIHSPSKIFTEYGKYIDEGLANGIDKGENSVISAISDLANSTINGFNIPDVGLNSTLGIGIADALDNVENKPISLLLRIDGEDIPISAERITNALNDQTLLANHNLVTI